MNRTNDRWDIESAILVNLLATQFVGSWGPKSSSSLSSLAASTLAKTSSQVTQVLVLPYETEPRNDANFDCRRQYARSMRATHLAGTEFRLAGLWRSRGWCRCRRKGAPACSRPHTDGL